jgi:hypothetical protein
MTDTLALEKLFTDVAARFELDRTPAGHFFGWREPAAQAENGDRIVWVPGDPNGALGAVEAARQPGRNPRPLATLRELFTCEISAADASDPENELVQYKAARLLFDSWLRACQLAARTSFRVESATWVTDKNLRRHGAAMRVVCSIEAMVPDVVREVMPTDGLKAEVDVAELDNTETMTANRSDTP